MMRLRCAVLGGLLVVLIGVCSVNGQEAKKQPFLPLAWVDVRLPERKSDEFIKTIHTFAIGHGFRIEDADLPKRGRIVTRFRIIITDKTFLSINNFRDTSVFEVIAYSHEDAAVWQSAWKELISMLLSRVGEANIIKRK